MTDGARRRPRTTSRSGARCRPTPPAVADVYLASFKSTYDFPLAHTDEEVRGWIADEVVPRMETWVAEIGDGRSSR